MTNDELEQIMNFIIERHERLGDQLNQIAAETTRQMERASQQQELADILLEAQTALTESVEKLTRKDAEHDERIARFERSYVAIARLLQKHDAQIAIHDARHVNHDEILAVLTNRLDRLAQTVERYVTARGTNGDIGNGQS